MTKNKPKKVTITVRITNHLNKELNVLAKKHHNSKSGFINQLIDSYIKKERCYDINGFECNLRK